MKIEISTPCVMVAKNGQFNKYVLNNQEVKDI